MVLILGVGPPCVAVSMSIIGGVIAAPAVVFRLAAEFATYRFCRRDLERVCGRLVVGQSASDLSRTRWKA